MHVAVMEEHAEAAAERFVSTLSRVETEQLMALFEGLERKGVPLNPTADRSLNVSGLQRVVDQFTDTCTNIAKKLGLPLPTAGSSEDASPRLISAY